MVDVSPDEQPLGTSLGLSDKEIQSFQAGGFTTVGQLLEHFPKRYEDRTRFDVFPNQAGGDAVCLRGMVVDSSTKHFGPARRCYEAIILDGCGGVFGSGKITCRWFNMPFMKSVVAVGHEVSVYGKVKEWSGKLIIDHPDFEILQTDETTKSLHMDRVVPIYRAISGINQRRLREIIYHLLVDGKYFEDVETANIDPIQERGQAFRGIHFPDTIEIGMAMRRRFALEEFFGIQLNVLWRRRCYVHQAGRVLGNSTKYLKQFYASLPFDFTGAQKRTIKEILADMRRPSPMNRLLQGDVGSGKTFVAMAAILLAIESGCQAALMAPTQILAEQHYLTFVKWLEPLGIRILLHTANRQEATHLERGGEPQVIIGTHALLFDKITFSDLGLVVVDEQHKFGVNQRAALIQQGIVPDVLVMTATPIPRTLTMTVYGDLDVSVLDEKPLGRGKIITGLRIGAKQLDVTKFVKDQLGQGRQAYLLYPLVDESETSKVESATEAFEKWQKRLSKYRVGLIHGKLRPEEKEKVMRRFRDGEIHALVATTVIEVGVDVPNASVMIVHHAERFGLAQLHQIRGRIGRGEHKSYCILLTDGKNPSALDKLKVLERTSDGFEIAEQDLRLRGPGDVLGNAQSGLSELRFSDYLADTSLLIEARAKAEDVLKSDPDLNRKFQHLMRLIRPENISKNVPGGFRD